MEHHIYASQEFKKPSFLQKVLGQKIKENVLIEINNLLATKELHLITVEEIHAIAHRYGVDLQTDYDHEIGSFYKQYLSSCLQDKYISEGEVADLRHLKKIFNLSDRRVNEIHQELAGEVYKNAIENVIKDGELDEAERQFIEKLQTDLQLSQELAANIYQKSGQELIRQFMEAAIADAKLTPQEEKDLQAIARNLNAELKLDDATKSDLEKYKLYWRIENEDLPEIAVEIGIPRTERCYFQAETAWLERSVPETTKTSTVEGLKLKIAKGLYWRGNAGKQKNTQKEQWQEIDNGKVYLTNKRLLFKGGKGDKIILLNRIYDFTVFDNGVEIEKEDSRRIFLQTNANPDVLAMLLGKALSQVKA